MIARGCGLALLLVALAAGAVPGPALPIPAAPGGVYRDDDPAARIDTSRTRGEPRVVEQRLLAQIARQPEAARLRAELGYVRAQLGAGRASDAAFADALALARDDAMLRRHVLWSWGWALFDRDEPRAALNAWRRAEELHGGKPHWVAYTYPIALWTLGERDAAVRWYDAAFASFPGNWGTRENLARRTRHWRPKQRAAIDAVHAAWSQRRPQEKWGRG